MYTTEVGINDIYKHYKDKCEKINRRVLDRKLATSILKDFNLMLRELILDNEEVKLPYNLGTLSIKKFEVNYNPDKQYRWSVNWQKTKEVGYKVYHGETYGYRWRWDKTKVKLVGKKHYHFKPCRAASRNITKKLSQGVDYYTVNNKPFFKK